MNLLQYLFYYPTLTFEGSRRQLSTLQKIHNNFCIFKHFVAFLKTPFQLTGHQSYSLDRSRIPRGQKQDCTSTMQNLGFKSSRILISINVCQLSHILCTQNPWKLQFSKSKFFWISISDGSIQSYICCIFSLPR